MFVCPLLQSVVLNTPCNSPRNRETASRSGCREVGFSTNLPRTMVFSSACSRQVLNQNDVVPFFTVDQIVYEFLRYQDSKTSRHRITHFQFYGSTCGGFQS